MSLFRNQSSILNIDEFDYLNITVIGVGSIGSFLALALNKIGFVNIAIVDNDTVEPHNIATQMYNKSHIGQKKVHAIRHFMRGDINSYYKKITARSKINSDIVCVCVDDLKQRKIILKAILDSKKRYGKPKLLIDGRMHRLLFRVFTIDLTKKQLVNKYTESLMGKEFTGACTEKGIIQNVFGVVGVMMEQLKKVLNNEEYSSVINYDFENYETQKLHSIEPYKVKK